MVVWRHPSSAWKADVSTDKGSPQIVELTAVVTASQIFSVLLNLVTDSAYAARIMMRAEASILKEVENSQLYWLQLLVFSSENRTSPFFGMHIQAHIDLPGFLTEGNREADLLTMPALQSVLPDKIEQAKLSHSFFHQNASSLILHFGITKAQASGIIAVCPDCQRCSFRFVAGVVNPRGLQSLQVWQSDDTHFSEFSHTRYIHSSIDSLSGALFAPAHSGETAKGVCRHFTSAFATHGIPSEVNPDNGPAYTSH